jgi:transposase
MAQDLTDAEWAFIEPLLPKLRRRSDGRGRPWRDSREVLNGILWVLRTGAQWSEMPSRYPPYQTCHRRFQRWRKAGVMDRLLEALARDLERRGQINLEECLLMVGSVLPKGGAEIGKTKRGKNSKVMALADGAGLPIALCAGSASPHETAFVTELIKQQSTKGKPERLIGDKAYDSDPLDETCERLGVNPNLPARRDKSHRFLERRIRRHGSDR